MDRASQKVLATKAAITLETCQATNVFQQEFNQYGTLSIVNTDLGSQFRAKEFGQVVKRQGCKLSTDYRGALRDKVFEERLWK